MRDRIIVLCAVTAITLAHAAPGEASWGWLEKLSGPGGFVTAVPGVTFPVFCLDTERHLIFCEAPGRRRLHVTLEVMRWESKENLLFGDDGKKLPFAQVRILEIAPSVLVPVVRGLSAGASVGYHRFTGDAFESFARFSFEPRLSWAPLESLVGDEPWARVVTVTAGLRRFSGFTTSDFCDATRGCDITALRELRDETEWLPRIAVVFDAFELLRFVQR